MGCAPSRVARQVDYNTSKEIDELLEKEHVESSNHFKLLLLGAGEGGKSTIVKQMRIIHGAGYSVSDRMHYRHIVHLNATQSLFAILGAMEKLNIHFSNQAYFNDIVKRLCEMTSQLETTGINEEMGKLMIILWREEAIQSCLARSKEYQLNDSAGYFLSELSRISKIDYIPSEEDVLKARVITTGINETQFTIKGSLFKMIDVGGQRSQRRKWLHCFEEVTAVIFCTALSEYDLFLEEDNKVNRMKESMQLFDSICNNRWLTKKPLVLFMNKTDLLKKKIKHIPLTVCFPEYTGPKTCQGATQYIEDMFKSFLPMHRSKEIYVHLTCAIDTQNIQWVFDVVSETVFKLNQKECGLF